MNTSVYQSTPVPTLAHADTLATRGAKVSRVAAVVLGASALAGLGAAAAFVATAVGGPDATLSSLDPLGMVQPRATGILDGTQFSTIADSLVDLVGVASTVIKVIVTGAVILLVPAVLLLDGGVSRAIHILLGSLAMLFMAGVMLPMVAGEVPDEWSSEALLGQLKNPSDRAYVLAQAAVMTGGKPSRFDLESASAVERRADAQALYAVEMAAFGQPMTAKARDYESSEVASQSNWLRWGTAAGVAAFLALAFGLLARSLGRRMTRRANIAREWVAGKGL